MFLSIIIPIYNDEKYMSECIDSCLDQDYPSSDYEIICVDDGSTDRTPEILQEYAKNHVNIRLIFREHVGYGGRAVGFSEARGEYIWFVDHDDIVAPNAVKELAAATKDHSEYDRIAFPCYEFYYSLKPKELELIRKGSLQSNSNRNVHIFYVWSSIIKKSFIDMNQISPRSKRIDYAREYWNLPMTDIWGGDNIFMEECFDKGMTTVFLEGRPLYHYRRHDKSESMEISKSAREKRRLLRFNTAMVRAYTAMMFKEAYLHERAEFGRATDETTVKMIVRLRHTVIMLSSLPRKYWKQGIELMRAKGAFFRKKPEEYHFPLSKYMKNFNIIERYRLRSVLSYYFYSLPAIKIHRVLGTFDRLTSMNVLFAKTHRNIAQRRLLKKGTSKS